MPDGGQALFDKYGHATGDTVPGIDSRLAPSGLDPSGHQSGKCFRLFRVSQRQSSPSPLQSNFAIGGSKPTASIVYLLDYGLCREHFVGGKVRPERKTAGFRGTVRYASKATHVMKDLGRKDDIWSLYYTIAEWVNGGLPWSNEADAEIVYQMKTTTTHEKLCPRIEAAMVILGGYLEGTR